MTVSGDFIPVDDGQDFESSAPTFLGISLSPTVLGVIFAVLGIAGAAALFFQLAQPAIQRVKDTEAQVQQLQQKVTAQQQNAQLIRKAQTDLEVAQERRQVVTSLLASESSMNTLLLDINRVFLRQQLSTQPLDPRLPLLIPEDAKVPELKLVNFAPEPEAKVVDDTSFGQALVGKLKVQEISVSMEGDFTQTISVLRNLESLQPLLLVSDFTMQSDTGEIPVYVDPQGQVIPFVSRILKTSFKIRAVMPGPEPQAQPPAAQQQGAPGQPPPAQPSPPPAQ